MRRADASSVSRHDGERTRTSVLAPGHEMNWVPSTPTNTQVPPVSRRKVVTPPIPQVPLHHICAAARAWWGRGGGVRTQPDGASREHVHDRGGPPDAVRRVRPRPGDLAVRGVPPMCPEDRTGGPPGASDDGAAARDQERLVTAGARRSCAAAGAGSNEASPRSGSVGSSRGRHR